MTAHGQLILDELARGPLTVAELMYETGLAEKTVWKYMAYFSKFGGRLVYVSNWEVSEKTNFLRPIYKIGPGKDMTRHDYRMLNKPKKVRKAA